MEKHILKNIDHIRLLCLDLMSYFCEIKIHHSTKRMYSMKQFNQYNKTDYEDFAIGLGCVILFIATISLFWLVLA